MAFGNASTRTRRLGRILAGAPFGLSAQAWPFFKALVASSSCGLALYVAGRLLVDWQPAAWGMADRLALVLKCAVFAMLPAIAAIVVVASQRLRSDFFVGTKVRPYSPLDINTRTVLNSIEQFVVYLGGMGALGLFLTRGEASAVPILTGMFVIGRAVFWYGYHNNAFLRAFGFGLTFYPMLVVYAWLVVRMVTGIHIPV